MNPMEKLNPKFSGPEAQAVVREFYGIDALTEPLPSERDQNFRLTDKSGQTFVLKISNSAERKDILKFQNDGLYK